MKTYNNLFDAVCSVENVREALHKAAKGKRHKRSVVKALAHEDEVVEEISRQLREGTWRPPKVHNAHEINDGVQMKKRIIVTPNFVQEQVVHHALMNVISPLFLKKFYRWSCGSVPGRGQEEIVRMLRKRFGRSDHRHYKYCCKLDVKKFFNTVSPLAIFKEIRRTVSDKKVLLLISRILRSNTVVDEHGNRMKGGIPIGFYTSPWFANIALNRIDHLVKDGFGIKLYVRYMDDMLFFHPNKRELKRCCEAVEAELAKFGLELKYPTAIHRFFCGRHRMVRFTGYCFDGEKVYLHDSVFLKARRIAARILKKRSIDWRNFTIYDAERIISYAARFPVADAYKAFVKYVLRGNRISVSKCRQKVSKDAKFRNAMARMRWLFCSFLARRSVAQNPK